MLVYKLRDKLSPQHILFNIKKFLIKYLDNIITRLRRVGMRAVNGKLIIQLEWP